MPRRVEFESPGAAADYIVASLTELMAIARDQGLNLTEYLLGIAELQARQDAAGAASASARLARLRNPD